MATLHWIPEAAEFRAWQCDMSFTAAQLISKPLHLRKKYTWIVMPLGVCSAAIIKCTASKGAVAEYIELSLICACTTRKQQIPVLSICWEYKLGAQRGQGIWTERGECNMLSGNSGEIREVEKQTNRDTRRLDGKDRAEEEWEIGWVRQMEGVTGHHRALGQLFFDILVDTMT